MKHKGKNINDNIKMMSYANVSNSVKYNLLFTVNDWAWNPVRKAIEYMKHDIESIRIFIRSDFL